MRVFNNGTGYHIIAGTVKSKREISETEAELVLTSMEWDRQAQEEIEENLTVRFKNTEKAKLKTRCMKSSITNPGTFLSVEALSVAGDPFTFEATDYCQPGSGLYRCITEKGRNVTYIHGIVKTVRERNRIDDGTPIYQIGIPIEKYDTASHKYVTTWYSVSFLSTYGACEKASRAIHKDSHVIVRCGEVKQNESNGKVYNNLIGYSFRLCPKLIKQEKGKKVKSSNASSEPAINPPEPPINGEPAIQ